MSAGTYNILDLEQGATFNMPVTLSYGGVSFPLQGYTGRAQMRKKATDPDPPVGVFTVEIIDAPTGKLVLRMTATQTAAIPAGNYVYDLEIQNGDTVLRVLKGSVTVTAQVTR